MVLGNPLAKEKWGSCCHFVWLMLVNVGEKFPKINKQLPDIFFQNNYQNNFFSCFFGKPPEVSIGLIIAGLTLGPDAERFRRAGRIGHC